MNADEMVAAELVFDDMIPPRSFGFFKRETEGLIGRDISPVEAQQAFDSLGGRTNG